MHYASPFDQLPKGTKFLIISCSLLYFAQNFLPGWLSSSLALTPVKLIQSFQLWQVVTYAFFHGSFWHLFFNMFSLWMFGSSIERYWGTKTFLIYYFLCVIGAAITQILLAPESTMIGASGGIYGLLLGFGFLFPDAIISLFFFFPLRAIQAVFVIALLTLFSSFESGGTRVAHLAHLGGLATGYLYFKFPVWVLQFRQFTGGAFHRKPKFHVIQPTEEDLARKVDEILEKISKHGTQSLTPKEHEIMRKYSEKKN